jgi:hypothetical protein
VERLTRAQKDLAHGTPRLARHDLKTLASIIVEFAEDLHCGIGIWRSLDSGGWPFPLHFP